MHTIQNNFTTAYLYYATHTEEGWDDYNSGPAEPPCIYDYICGVEETPLDCETPEELNAVLTCIWHMPDVGNEA